MEEQLRRLQEERTCKVCMDKEVSIVFIPCGHLVVCKDCAPSLRKCPICRGTIKGTVRTFLSWRRSKTLSKLILELMDEMYYNFNFDSVLVSLRFFYLSATQKILFYINIFI